ncbi:hypothetical protein GP486_005630 [Trichoglossum hirsutum]|uniref:NACHT domain-containing protein n=1 Tax=Trichoglossum hirsutum TaxID=265104 RepID=A0A9P8L8W3_9PEZI|nr:hypothetical protein GP486_005630 [Trichoglossum hirsutum]
MLDRSNATSNNSFLERSFGCFRSQPPDSESADEVRGLLGLNLLFAPPEPLVDLIFVHGLGGGSRKTWSKTSSISHFWPREWLPKDPDFEHVRIHSFGYDANWGDNKSSGLNIYDFGKSLLGEIDNTPCIRRCDMYILARQDASYRSLAQRFHAIYFLATPHRGSDLAEILNSILRISISHTARPYVADIERNSGLIQSINEEFRHYYGDLELWSFYETVKTNLGVAGALIVNKDSATLGYREEKSAPVNASHREICKFDQPTDPNFVTIRNALAFCIHNLTKTLRSSARDVHRSQMKTLGSYLGVLERPDDDLAAVEEMRLAGSCRWFTAKKSYTEWREFSPECPRVLWINARPATGKSVLAGYIINELETGNSNCSYYFFKYGDKSKSRLSACLRSIAYQMALMSVEVREKLLAIHDDDIKFDKEDERAVWRKIFLAGIFQTVLPRQYWVIDALDECSNFSAFAPLLGKLGKDIPLRILITSRQSLELEKHFSSLGSSNFCVEEISTADTLPDIKLYAETRMESLPVESEQGRADLISKILRKSEGCFLWTVLVLRELADSFGEEDIKQVLDDVPQDMDPLYARALEVMGRAPRGKKLAKAILTWAACSMRPLTTKELEHALKLDMGDSFPNLERSVSALCGQLVCVDKHSRVQMVHQTAREFLLKGDLESEFAIDKAEAHTSITRTCLLYLTGEEMRVPRNRKPSANRPLLTRKSEFSSYACTAFSEHLALSRSGVDNTLSLLDKFLKANVLSWIHDIAQSQDLYPLTRAAKNFKTYLERRTKYCSPLGQELRSVRAWATDLIRVPAKFGEALLLSPSATYSLISPFCPNESAMFQIGDKARGMTVVGPSESTWDDRLSCIDYPDSQTSAVAYGDLAFAVGLSTGAVILYHKASFQELKVLQHGETVKLLEFKASSELMASAGMKAVKVWDLRSGDMIWSFEAPKRCLALAFSGDVLFAASSCNFLASWCLAEGTQRPSRPWHNTSEDQKTIFRRPPTTVSISLEQNMLAIAYRGCPINLWDLECDSFFGFCGKQLSDGQIGPYSVSALAFNSNPEIGLLAAAYSDGDLALIDPFEGKTVDCIRADAHTLTSSPDGRTLVSGDAFGTIQIFEFDTLKLLYRIRSHSCNIRQLVFSGDGLRFLDIRGSQCNVWEPPVLVRGDDGDFDSEVVSTAATLVDLVGSDDVIKISCMLGHPAGAVIFCGKEDGSVTLFETETGKQVCVLYRHSTLALIRLLAWGKRGNTLTSVDASNTVVTWKLNETSGGIWTAETLLFQVHVQSNHSINQVLLNHESSRILISTGMSDHLLDGIGREVQARAYEARKSWRWVEHPLSQHHLICLDRSVARVYDWHDWNEVMTIDTNMNTMTAEVRNTFTTDDGSKIVAEYARDEGQRSCVIPHLWICTRGNLDDLPERSDLLASKFPSVADQITHIVGLSGSTLIFLNPTSWVCSIDLSALVPDGGFVRHFFVPYDWHPSSRDLVCTVTTKRDLVFVRGGEIAVVKKWLENQEHVKSTDRHYRCGGRESRRCSTEDCVSGKELGKCV